MRRALAALIVACLTACGGGGGGADVPSAPAAAASPAFSSTPALTPACTGCAAADAGTYRGSGAGVWSYSNPGDQAVSVPVAIDGLEAGKTATYLLTNDASAVPAQTDAAGMASLAALHGDEIQAFNRIGWRRLAGAERPMLAPAAADPAPAAVALGSVRSFYDKDNGLRSTRLVRQATAGDGRTLRLWLEAGEGGAGRITDAMLDDLLQGYAGPGGVYERAVDLGGPPWGPHNYPTLIAPTGQPVDIVLLNFNRDGQPMGLVGYFWARNAFRKTVEPYSNESVSVYLDTETAYLASDGLAQARSVLAHETLHMLNFYRRNLVMGAFGYDTWLEEMTAMMLEDLLDAQTGGARAPMLPRLYAYMTLGEYYCGLAGFKAPVGTHGCDGYALGGTYGAYLLRQHGVGLFREILAAPVHDGEALVDSVLARRGTSLRETTRRMQAAVLGAMAPGEAPAGYGLPPRQDEGFALRGLDPSRFAASLPLSARFPADPAPAPGGALVRRVAVAGRTLTDTVQVPPHTTLTVVIDDAPLH